MYKFCPHCGKAFLEPDEPREIVLRTSQEKRLTWAQVKEWSDKGEASQHFQAGDEIAETLKTGEEVIFTVVGTDMYRPGDAIFGLKDCLKDTYVMNDDCTNAGGWKASKLRRVLNTEILAQLPDDLRACIKPRVIDGEVDTLWLFSEREIFGDNEWTEEDVDSGLQMPYFKRKGNRVKGLGKDGDAYWWWERSPFSGNSGGFCYVNVYGGANFSYASYSSGVAFGFCV